MHDAMANRAWVLVLRAVVFVLAAMGLGLAIVPFVSR